MIHPGTMKSVWVRFSSSLTWGLDDFISAAQTYRKHHTLHVVARKKHRKRPGKTLNTPFKRSYQTLKYPKSQHPRRNPTPILLNIPSPPPVFSPPQDQPTGLLTRGSTCRSAGRVTEQSSPRQKSGPNTPFLWGGGGLKSQNRNQKKGRCAAVPLEFWDSLVSDC